MRSLIVIVIALFAAAGALRLYRYNAVRLAESRAAMEAALRRQGFVLVSARLCWLALGPFAAAIARHQPVYRVRVRDRFDRARRGWVRCEPFSERTETAWEVTPGGAWPSPR